MNSFPRRTGTLLACGVACLLSMGAGPQVRASDGPAVLSTRGFAAFARGTFEDGGGNLYVNAHGAVGMIRTWDVNTDGFPDLVLANSHDYTQLGPGLIYRPVRGWPGEKWLAQQLPQLSGWMSRVVDLDGDGFADLVVANGENGVTSQVSCYVYWGGPDGLTGQRAEFPTAGAYDVAIVDLDSDGRLDLVFPSAWKEHHASGLRVAGSPPKPRRASVYLQREKRNFTEASERFGIEGQASVAVAAADLNADGFPDLVVANYRANEVIDIDSSVYWGVKGGLNPVPTHIATHGAQQVTLGDLNGDGWVDLIFSGADRVQICWNRAGKFRPADQLSFSAKGLTSMFSQGILRCAIADLEGRGQNDLIVATLEGLEIRPGRDPARIRQILPVRNLVWVTAGDLDGDGRTDLVASRFREDDITDTTSPIFWNGPAGFSVERATWIPTSGAVGNTVGALGDERVPRVIFHNTLSGHEVGKENYVYLGSDGGGYGVDRRITLQTDGSSSCLVADLDLDGYPEVVMEESGAILRIFRGSPAGPSSGNYYDLAGDDGGASDIQAADFNHDGYLDLLVASSARTAVFFGSKEGFSYGRRQDLPMKEDFLCLADFNGDGFLDIAVSNTLRNEVSTYLNGPGGFRPEPDWKVKVNYPMALNAADLNADGRLDLIVSEGGHYWQEKDSVQIFYGGAEGFAVERSQKYSGGYTPGQTSVADYNRDGHLDLLVTAYSSVMSRVIPAQLFLGDGQSIDFVHGRDLPAAASFAALSLDLDRDGWTDVFLTCHRGEIGHRVDSLIYWNQQGSFSPDRVTGLPGLGPNGTTQTRDRGNARTRKPEESYVSEPFEVGDRRVSGIAWSAETPFETKLDFQLRWAATKESLEQAEWLGPEGTYTYYVHPSEVGMRPGSPARWVQYRARFSSPWGCGSPLLREVVLTTVADGKPGAAHQRPVPEREPGRVD